MPPTLAGLRAAGASTTLRVHMAEVVRSRANARIQRTAHLVRDAAERRRLGRVAVEGLREVERAFANGWMPQEVYVSESLAAGAARSLLQWAQANDVPITTCTPDVFAKIAYRENPEGLLAVGPMPTGRLEALDVPDAPLLLAAAEIEKPGNLGALLRTADGVAVDAVLVCGDAVDLGNPNLIRSSLGTVFYLPLAVASSDEAVAWLGQRRIRVVAADPDADTVYCDADLRGPLAIVVGAEDRGLPEAWRRAADVRVSIPMRGQNDSLNVSVAAAVLLYEALRQRSRAGADVAPSGPSR